MAMSLVEAERASARAEACGLRNAGGAIFLQLENIWRQPSVSDQELARIAADQRSERVRADLFYKAIDCRDLPPYLVELDHVMQSFVDSCVSTVSFDCANELGRVPRSK
jgi:hypothetical protein